MPDPISVSGRFSIVELTGQLRQIDLLGRALPYQRVAFGGETKNKLTFYPGNPQGTLQVLASTLQPTVLQGMWKDRFVPGQVEAVGFDGLSPGDTATASLIVRAFEELRRSGQRLRVQWYDVVREGVLSRFTPTWIRPQDVEWEAEFTWFQENVEAPRAGDEPPDDRPALRRSMDENDRAFRDVRGRSVERSFRSAIGSFVRSERVQLAQSFAALNTISRALPGAVVDLSEPVNALAACASTIRSEVSSALVLLTDLPYTEATLVDAVLDVLGAESWRRTVGLTQDGLAVSATRVALREAERNVGALGQTVVVPGDTTLRMLSLRYYGTSDSWQRIADANGLTDSLVRAGTTIYIPPSRSR